MPDKEIILKNIEKMLDDEDEKIIQAFNDSIESLTEKIFVTPR